MAMHLPLLLLIFVFPISLGLHVMHVSECGTTRGCWRVPEGCSTDCDFIVTWKHHGRAVTIEMESSMSLVEHGGWIGFAISRDKLMGNDTVVECEFNTKGGGNVHLSHNLKHENIRLSTASQMTLKDSWTEVVDGKVQCGTEWRLDLTILSKEEKRMIHPLNSGRYHLLFAKGALRQDGEKEPHGLGDELGPLVSMDSIRFCKDCGQAGHQVVSWTQMG